MHHHVGPENVVGAVIFGNDGIIDIGVLFFILVLSSVNVLSEIGHIQAFIFTVSH